MIQGLHSLKIEVFALESRYEKGEEESVALRHPRSEGGELSLLKVVFVALSSYRS